MSTINVNDFNTLFLATVNKLAIAENQRETVLEFIRLLLTVDNNLPCSYNKIKKSVEMPDIKNNILCKFCNKKIEFEKIGRKKFKKFTKTLCISNRQGIKSKSLVKVIEVDIVSQLRIILDNHKQSIDSYHSN